MGAEITEDWSSTLDQINLLINGAVKNVKKTLTIGYEDAYACMPGCTCDNIILNTTVFSKFNKSLLNKCCSLLHLLTLNTRSRPTSEFTVTRPTTPSNEDY